MNPLVDIIDSIHSEVRFGVLPYCELHGKWHAKDFSIRKPLFTHVRGAIPPHVTPEVDLKRFEPFPVIFAGDLHSRTVTSEDAMVPTDYHHTIYELEGDIADLSSVANSDLLDKKVVKRKTEAALILDKDMTIEEELVEYLSYILELEDNKVKDILSTFHDYAKEIAVG